MAQGPLRADDAQRVELVMHLDGYGNAAWLDS